MSEIVYTTGSWRAVVSPSGVAVLPPTVGADLLDRVWRALEAGQGLGAVLESLAGTFGAGLSALPPFAVATFDGARVAVAVRGELVIEIDEGVDAPGASAPVVVSGADVTTWSERAVAAASGLLVRTPAADAGAVGAGASGTGAVGAGAAGTDAAGADRFGIASGVVLAATLEVALAAGRAPAPAAVAPPAPRTAASAPDMTQDVPTGPELTQDVPTGPELTQVVSPGPDLTQDVPPGPDVTRDVPSGAAPPAPEAEPEGDVSATVTEVEGAPDVSRSEGSPLGATQSEGAPLAATQDVAAPVAATQDVEAPVAATQEAEAPLGATQDVAAPLAATQDVAAPVAATQEAGELPEEVESTRTELPDDAYDHLWGATVVKSVEDAAVRDLEEDEHEEAASAPSAPSAPASAPAAAPAPTPAPAPAEPRPVVPPVASSGLIDSVPSFGSVGASSGSSGFSGITVPPTRSAAPAPAGAPAAVPPSAPAGPAFAPPTGAPADAAPPAGTAASAGDDHDGLTVTVSELEAMRRLAEAAPVAELPADALGRIVLSTGESYALDRPVIIGRRPRANRVQADAVPVLVTVPSPEQDISRNHLEIRLEGRHVLAVDLATTNGSVLHRDGSPPKRLGPNEPELVLSNDVIDLGDGVTVAFEEIP
jgi:hypothetical protein